MKIESVLDDVVGGGERAVGIAGLDIVLVGEIVGQRFVDRSRAQSGLAVDERRQFLPFDFKQFAGVLGFGARRRQHGSDRLALKVRYLDGDERLWRHLVAGPVVSDSVGDEFAAVRGDVSAGEDERDTGRLSGARGID